MHNLSILLAPGTGQGLERKSRQDNARPWGYTLVLIQYQMDNLTQTLDMKSQMRTAQENRQGIGQKVGMTIRRMRRIDRHT